MAGIALQLAGLFGLLVAGAVVTHFLWNAIPRALYLSNFGIPPLYCAIGFVVGLVFFAMSSMMSSFGCLIGGRVRALRTENQLPWLFWTAARDATLLTGAIGLCSLRLYLHLGVKSPEFWALPAGVMLLGLLAFLAHRKVRIATRPLHIPES